MRSPNSQSGPIEIPDMRPWRWRADVLTDGAEYRTSLHYTRKPARFFDDFTSLKISSNRHSNFDPVSAEFVSLIGTVVDVEIEPIRQKNGSGKAFNTCSSVSVTDAVELLAVLGEFDQDLRQHHRLIPPREYPIARESFLENLDEVLSATQTGDIYRQPIPEHMTTDQVHSVDPLEFVGVNSTLAELARHRDQVESIDFSHLTE